jgi:hypothetical protein
VDDTTARLLAEKLPISTLRVSTAENKRILDAVVDWVRSSSSVALKDLVEPLLHALVTLTGTKLSANPSKKQMQHALNDVLDWLRRVLGTLRVPRVVTPMYVVSQIHREKLRLLLPLTNIPAVG